MTDYEPGSNERIDSRTERALTHYLMVLADVGRAKGADDLFLVVSQSGTEYLVDTHIGAYECPDRGHRVVRCKPTRRVAFATGEHPVPAGVDGAVPKPKYRRRTGTTPSRRRSAVSFQRTPEIAEQQGSRSGPVFWCAYLSDECRREMRRDSLADVRKAFQSN